MRKPFPAPRAVYGGDEGGPARQWQYPYPPYLRLEILPHTVVVGSFVWPYRPVFAFDRTTGRELWRRGEGPTTSGSRDTGERWRLVGAAHRGGEEVVLLHHVRLHAPESADGRINFSEIVAADARTGATLWTRPLLPGLPRDVPEPNQVIGELVVVFPAWAEGSAGTRNRDYRRAAFLDALTGAEVHPDTQEGQAALRTAALIRHSPLAVIADFSPWLLHLQSGVVSRLAVFDWLRGSAGRVGAASGTIVLRVDPDDDGAGHSMWAKYLHAADATGRKKWQFPVRLIDRTTGETGPFESVRLAVMSPGHGRIYAAGETNALYGLRARDGKVLWTLPRKALNAVWLTPYRNGCFVLACPAETGTVSPDYSSLAWVEGKTGRVRWLTRLPYCLRIEAEGDDLFTVAYKGAVRVYSCQQLFAMRYAPTKK